MNKLIIISGRARSGKDTFARLLKNQIVNKGFTSKVYSFAFALKNELKDTIKERYGLDVFTDNTEDKEVFRHLLIQRGKERRDETNGKYWAELIRKEIIADNNDFSIIADNRYVSEIEMFSDFGIVKLHITKWDLGRNGTRLSIPSNNKEENIHDPLVKDKADYFVNWTAPQNNQFLDNWCNDYVTDFINHYAEFFKKGERDAFGGVGKLYN